jgi:hypothetical protein
VLGEVEHPKALQWASIIGSSHVSLARRPR